MKTKQFKKEIIEITNKYTFLNIQLINYIIDWLFNESNNLLIDNFLLQFVICRATIS